MSSRPPATITFVPARTAAWVPATEPIATAVATGSRCTPVDSGL